MASRRPQRSYDPRLILLVQLTGDAALATRVGVPRSTAAGWLRRARRDLVTAPVLASAPADLTVRVARLERRVRRLMALLRVLVALLHVLRPDMRRLRIPDAQEKARLLRAIERSRAALGLGRVLRLVGLSPSRLAAWRRAARACELEDATSCPRSSPQRLRFEEIWEIRSMVTAEAFRHVPTGRLAVLAQRLGRVVASPSTWHRLVRERGWRRPRVRVHPEAPREGVRATRPNQIWHVDVTLLRLLDGTRAYLQAVVDNFSRRVLAWRVTDRFEPGLTATLLVEAAGAGADVGRRDVPILLADAGVENLTLGVEALIAAGRLRRVLARTEIDSSNSVIEAFWRQLKHHWLFLNRLDSVAAVRRLVAFYVDEHNRSIPHSAFDGRTPDEMYFRKGAHVPVVLLLARQEARRQRLEVHRAARCAVCV